MGKVNRYSSYVVELNKSFDVATFISMGTYTDMFRLLNIHTHVLSHIVPRGQFILVDLNNYNLSDLELDKVIKYINENRTSDLILRLTINAYNEDFESAKDTISKILLESENT